MVYIGITQYGRVVFGSSQGVGRRRGARLTDLDAPAKDIDYNRSRGYANPFEVALLNPSWKKLERGAVHK